MHDHQIWRGECGHGRMCEEGMSLGWRGGLGCSQMITIVEHTRIDRRRCDVCSVGQNCKRWRLQDSGHAGLGFCLTRYVLILWHLIPAGCSWRNSGNQGWICLASLRMEEGERWGRCGDTWQLCAVWAGQVQHSSNLQVCSCSDSEVYGTLVLSYFWVDMLNEGRVTQKLENWLLDHFGKV